MPRLIFIQLIDGEIVMNGEVMPVLRPFGLSAATLFAASVIMVAPVHLAVAAPLADLRVLHWNIAGVTINPFDESKPDNEGTLEVARRLVAMAEAKQPHLVSMNEACGRQANFTRGQLADRFGSAEIQFVDSAGTDSLCGYSEGRFFESGTALIAVGADEVLERRAYYFTNEGFITSTKTERAAACMLVSFQSTLGRVVLACSLHLDPKDERARQQAQTLVNVLTEDGILSPLVLAGDFNAPPDVFQNAVYAPEQGGQGQFIEVDYPENRNTSFGLKLDYVFGDRDHFATEASAEVLDPGNCPAFPSIDHPCSDHSALFGTLSLRVDVP